MSNNIRQSNGKLITLANDIVDRKYSVGLLGEGVERHSPAFSQTIYQLLENYASEEAPEDNTFINFDNNENVSPTPVTPKTGQLWYDTSVSKLKVYNGNQSSPNFGWTDIFEETVNESIIPADDGTQDIGTPSLQWHNIYATHVVIDNNRFADPDGLPALTINGNIEVKSSNDSLGNVAKIITEAGHNGIVGDLGDPFYRITTDSVRLGLGRSAGFRTYASNPSVIYPSSEAEFSSAPSNVKFGDEQTPFTTVFTKEYVAGGLGGFSTDNTVLLSGIDSITTETTSTVELGSFSGPVNNLHVTNLYTKKLTVIPESMDSDYTVNKFLYETGYGFAGRQSISETDKVSVVSASGNMKKVNVLDIFPVGFITMWGIAGQDIPFGWRICDGSTYLRGSPVNINDLTTSEREIAITTPNLKDRFVVGASTDGEVGPLGTNNTVTSTSVDLGSYTTSYDGEHDHGGTAGHILEISEMPNHSHTYVRRSGSRKREAGSDIKSWNGLATFNTDYAGGSQPHSHNMNVDGGHEHQLTVGIHSHSVDLTTARIYKTVYIMKVI